MSKRLRVEKADARQEFARFMKGAKKYEIIIEFENPQTDEIFEVPIIYTPATAFDLAAIYADFDADADVEEQFDYSCDVFNFCIDRACGIKFVNCEKGQANYEAGEISIRDLTVENKQLLETAFSPGVGKSGPQLEQKLKGARRQVGKGVSCKNAAGMDVGAASDLLI